MEKLICFMTCLLPLSVLLFFLLSFNGVRLSLMKFEFNEILHKTLSEEASKAETCWHVTAYHRY